VKKGESTDVFSKQAHRKRESYYLRIRASTATATSRELVEEESKPRLSRDSMKETSFEDWRGLSKNQQRAQGGGQKWKMFGARVSPGTGRGEFDNKEYQKGRCQAEIDGLRLVSM